MPLSATDIFNKLSEWPHRGAGSENEMMAREMLMTQLVGEPGVDVAEEGLMAPATYLPFFWMVALGQALAIIISIWFPLGAIMAGLVFFISHFLFFDWRVSSLVWWSPKKLTANLVAKKGNGRRLILLMAHLDSAPASFAYRAEQVKNFAVSVYLGTAIVGLGVIIPVLDSYGWVAPLWLRLLLVAAVLAQPIIASVDFWRFGYTPGANDNLSGVAAATEAASRLWRHMPANSEIRLVITTAEEAGMLGAQHYYKMHEDELKDRDTHVLNFDTVGNANLKYIVRSGGFTPVHYYGELMKAAKQASLQNPKFKGITAGIHRVGDFDSVWFARGGISTLTIASYDDEAMMPHIHTPKDTRAFVDIRQMVLSAAYGEALIRLLPPPEEAAR